MAVIIRLSKVGAIHEPVYRVVVTDSRKVGVGKAVENLGLFSMKTKTADIKIAEDRAVSWLQKGARPTPRVLGIFKKTGIWKKFEETRKK